MTAPAPTSPLPAGSIGITPGTTPEGRLHLIQAVAGRGPPQLVRLLPAGLARIGIEARVTGHDDAGRPILQTPLGAFFMENGPKLPKGATLRLALVSEVEGAVTERRSGAQGSAARGEPPPLPSLPRAHADRALASVLLRLLTSHLNERRACEDGSGPEEARSTLDPLAPRPVADGWRLLPLVLIGETEELVRVFRRDEKHHEDTSETDGPHTRRLVLEVEWSRLGCTQIDLLVQGQKVDLKVRSQCPLAAEVAGDIGEVFLAALDAGGLKGTLSFVNPDHTSLPHASRPIDSMRA